jgi:predicted ATP-grasp superfamily ATP-dependent carboligase
MDKNVTPYIKYLISNIILVNDWIEKFGVGDDDDIIKHAEKISKEIEGIMNKMKSLGIDIDELHNESYDIEANIRDFKLKRVLTNNE